jgi:hypothetical protein
VENLTRSREGAKEDYLEFMTTIAIIGLKRCLSLFSSRLDRQAHRPSAGREANIQGLTPFGFQAAKPRIRWED